MSTTLGDEYPRQQERCRELLQQYRDIGPNGAFGCAVIEATLKEADEAAISGDLPRMIRAFTDMQAHGTEAEHINREGKEVER